MLSVQCMYTGDMKPPLDTDAQGPDLGGLITLVGNTISGAGKGAAQVVTAVGTQINNGLNIGKEFVEGQLKAANERHEKQKLELQNQLNTCDTRIANLGTRIAQSGLSEEFKTHLEKQLLTAQSDREKIAAKITAADDAHRALTLELTKSMGAVGQQFAQGIRETMSTVTQGFVPNLTAITNARIQGENDLKKHERYMKLISNPGLLALITGSVVGTFYGLKFVYQAAEDWYKVPELADKSTLVSPLTKFWRFITDAEVFTTTLDDVVLNPALTTKFKNYVEATKNIIENGGHLRHLLLPGPPGTGKTTLGFALAGELGIDAIYFNAGKLRNCALDISLRRLDQLFKNAERSEKPILIIIDESEIIFKHRDSKDLSEETKMVQNSIMARLGTPQNDFIVIALTNRPQDFDPAFISRFNNRIIEILPPVLDQRKQMIEMYVDKYLINPTFKPKSSWMSFIFGDEEAVAPIIEEQVFSPERILEIAQKTEGLSGRDINNLFMDIYSEAAATADMRITKAMVDTVVEEMIQNTQKYVAPQTTVTK